MAFDKVLALATLLCLPSLPGCAQNVLFADDFETGDVSAWSAELLQNITVP